jgi:FKBP-type peptidyl-prolyl cis-trans isomerase
MHRSLGLLGVACSLLGVACTRPAARVEVRPASSSTAHSVATKPAQGPPAPADVAAPPPDAVRDASGVASKILNPGQGTVHPGANDCVRLRYTSWKRDGSLHSSTERDALPLTQCMQRTMPGLVVALEQMVAGEARRVWLPGSLTYRSNDANAPAPSDDLTLDVALLEVLKAPDLPSDLRAPPRSARRTPSGLALRMLSPGTGARHALPNDRMQVRLTAWTSQGVLFESTELTGQPASVTRADVVPGVGEGLSLMQIGEKARLWVPAALAFGAQPRRGRPAGDMVYDLELVAVEVPARAREMH